MPFHELVCSMQFLSLSEQLKRIKESKHLEGIYLEEESEPCPVVKVVHLQSTGGQSKDIYKMICTGVLTVFPTWDECH